jgi:DNA-binding MarR family transcriptional regulator
MTVFHGIAHLSQTYFPVALAPEQHLAGQVARLVNLVEEISSRLPIGAAAAAVVPSDTLKRTRTDADNAMLAQPDSTVQHEMGAGSDEKSAESIALASARRLLSIRRKRETAFGGKLFCDPAWDILIELYVSRSDCSNLSVGDACVVSGVPLTSALRCCQSLEKQGIVWRERDPHDRRRIFLRLTDGAFAVLTKMLAVR